MSNSKIQKFVELLRRRASAARSLPELFVEVARVTREHLAADLVYVEDSLRGLSEFAATAHVPLPVREFVITDRTDRPLLNGEPVTFPLVFDAHRQPPVAPGTQSRMRESGVGAWILIPLYQDGLISGYITAASFENDWEFNDGDLYCLQTIADFLSSHMKHATVPRDGLRDKGLEEILHWNKLLFLRTDEELQLSEIAGDTRNILGRSPEEILSHDNPWELICSAEDLRELGREVRRQKTHRRAFSREVRLRIPEKEHSDAWAFLRASPRYATTGEFLGWDAFATDISEKRHTQEVLLSQSRRIQALYDVSRALLHNNDPARVMLRGLRAVIGATGSDCGFGCLLRADGSGFEIVAAQGLSDRYLQEIERVLEGDSLLRMVVESKSGVLLDNVQRDDRAAVNVAKREGLKATMIVPMVVEQRVIGALALFAKRTKQFDSEDLDLLTAATSQVALATERAELALRQRSEKEALEALYDLTHQLSGLVRPKEIAGRGLHLIADLFASERGWIGLYNEQTGGIESLAWFGEGMSDLSKELHLRVQAEFPLLSEVLHSSELHHFSGVALRSQSAGVLKDFLGDRAVEGFFVLPMKNAGKTIGLLALEPKDRAKNLFFEREQLLRALVTEIASVLTARVFEIRIADAEKMRMAGLLASGVAHNFNNLLQAIMGQASLIEMQCQDDELIAESARQIVNSSGRGAALIKQLLSFSLSEPSRERRFSFTSLLEDSRDLYRSILGPAIHLEMSLARTPTKVIGDYGQLQQVVTNLLMNAREALDEVEHAHVLVRESVVELAEAEVDPLLPAGQYIQVEIEDNGRGMDEERIERCFEPFFSTKNVDRYTGLSFQGSGLGLSSAYSLVRQHHGVIRVSSTPGEGTTFTLYLPYAEADVQSAEASLSQSSSNATLSTPAVIFDLEDSAGFSLRASLESLGLRVIVLSDRRRVIQMVEEQVGKPQVLFFDGDRFGSELGEFVQELEKVNPQVLCVVASVEKERLLISGDFGKRSLIVEKPLGLWSVQTALREALLHVPRGLNADVQVERNGGKDASASKVIAALQPSKRGQRSSDGSSKRAATSSAARQTKTTM